MNQQTLQIMLGHPGVKHGIFLRQMAGKEAERQLGNRLQLRIAGVAQPFVAAKNRMIRRHQVIQRAKLLQQLFSQLHDVHPRKTGAQKNGQQLRIRQCRCSVTQ
ncbi:hypothetical protein D3C80_1313080 [compost metagenome]